MRMALLNKHKLIIVLSLVFCLQVFAQRGRDNVQQMAMVPHIFPDVSGMVNVSVSSRGLSREPVIIDSLNNVPVLSQKVVGSGVPAEVQANLCFSGDLQRQFNLGQATVSGKVFYFDTSEHILTNNKMVLKLNSEYSNSNRRTHETNLTLKFKDINPDFQATLKRYAFPEYDVHFGRTTFNGSITNNYPAISIKSNHLNYLNQSLISKLSSLDSSQEQIEWTNQYLPIPQIINLAKNKIRALSDLSLVMLLSYDLRSWTFMDSRFSGLEFTIEERQIVYPQQETIYEFSYRGKVDPNIDSEEKLFDILKNAIQTFSRGTVDPCEKYTSPIEWVLQN